jgi:hypothetical protein
MNRDYDVGFAECLEKTLSVPHFIFGHGQYTKLQTFPFQMVATSCVSVQYL